MLFEHVTSTGKPLHKNPLGGNRDNANDKLDYTLVPIEALNRLVRHYMNGLKKYGRDNWKKLSLPADIERYRQSMFRHLIQYLENKKDEDHLAAIIWNAMCLIYFEEKPFNETYAETVKPVDVKKARENIMEFEKRIFDSSGIIALARNQGKSKEFIESFDKAINHSFANQQLKKLMDKALLKFRSSICSNCLIASCEPLFFTEELNGQINVFCRNFSPRSVSPHIKEEEKLKGVE